MTTIAPVIRSLEPAESSAFLSRHRVGRIAYSFHNRADIEPISYVSDNGWIYVRTSMGTKLSRLAHRPWCAFEVDEVHGMFDWTSVVVHGSLHLLDPETGSGSYMRALELLRRLVPDTFAPNDPTPERSIIVGIRVDEISGRTAATRTA